MARIDAEMYRNQEKCAKTALSDPEMYTCAQEGSETAARTPKMYIRGGNVYICMETAVDSTPPCNVRGLPLACALGALVNVPTLLVDDTPRNLVHLRLHTVYVRLRERQRRVLKTGPVRRDTFRNVAGRVLYSLHLHQDSSPERKIVGHQLRRPHGQRQGVPVFTASTTEYFLAFTIFEGLQGRFRC